MLKPQTTEVRDTRRRAYEVLLLQRRLRRYLLPLYVPSTNRRWICSLMRLQEATSNQVRPRKIVSTLLEILAEYGICPMCGTIVDRVSTLLEILDCYMDYSKIDNTCFNPS